MITRADARAGGYLPIIVACVLLLAAFIRWHSLEATSAMLHYDEAYNGVDVLGLIDNPTLTVFFPGNFGREAGWIYWLVPFVAALGAQPLALHLGSGFMGILGVAASYLLGKELLGKGGGVWTALALTVLYWHIHLSTLALRAIMMPTIGALTFAFLLRAKRERDSAMWAAGSVSLGLLTYTYFAARSWILLALLMLLWWFVRDRGQRKTVIAASVVATVIALPLVIYSIREPASWSRFEQVGVFSKPAILANTRAWLLAFFHSGDPSALFNVPYRPILDPFLGILFLVGLLGLFFVARRKAYVIWSLLLLLFALLPSLLSDFAPHFLRGSGAVIPVALFVAAGAQVIERCLQRFGLSSAGALVPLLMLLASGAVSFRAFHNDWVDSRDIYVTMERPINQAIQFVKERFEPGTKVYLSPFAPDHPNIRFHESILRNYQVGAFASAECLVVNDEPAVYASLTMYEPGFEQKLNALADVRLLYRDEVTWQNLPALSIFWATSHSPLPGPKALFGDRIQMESLQPLPLTIVPGATISLRLRFRALQPLDAHYSVFVHLYTLPPPEDGGMMVAQTDRKLCPTYPTPAWKLNESIVEEYSLAIPSDVPPGDYLVVVGLYESLSVSRLPLTAGDSGCANDCYPLGVLQLGNNNP